MKKLALCLVTVAVIGACSGSDDPGTAEPTPAPGPGVPNPAVQGVWTFRSGHGPSGPVEPAAGGDITLEVDGDEIRGSAGCNTFGGGVVIDGDTFDPGGLAVSEIGCPEPLVEPENRYLEALEAVETSAVTGKTLTLTGPDAELVFRRVPPVDPEPLTGTEWMLESLVEGPALEATVSSAKPATLLLNEDKSFEGTTGCRPFTGTWEVSGDVVDVTQLLLEGGCTGALRQDTHVATVLGGAFRVEIEGDELTLTAEAGGLALVYRKR